MTAARCAAVLAVLALAGCASPPPPKPQDACAIFEERAHWYSAALNARERWRIPASVMMAFVHHESSYIGNARPPRKKLFGFIPWSRPTSAYGYAQAIDGAWSDYKKETGRRFAFRNNFKDAIDFIGWYNDKSARTLGLNRNDAYSLYLAYHEGRAGYRRKSYLKKAWLLRVAKRVATTATRYRGQLKTCAGRLSKSWRPTVYW